MPDDKTNRGPADRSRVNIHEEYEIAHWCKAFGCTRAQLIAAVGAVGVSADAVRRHLGR